MADKKQKVDFNDEASFNNIVNEIASQKTGKKININIKLLAVVFSYFCISGIGLNIYWIVKLILKLF